MRAQLCLGGIAALGVIVGLAPVSRAATASDCPNDGVVRFGVEPYDTSPKLVPIYDSIGKLIGAKLGCEVKVFVTTSYNAEIEAMRNGKLEVGRVRSLGLCAGAPDREGRGGRDFCRRRRQAR